VGYYQGDPGFFSIVKHVAGAAAGMIPGVGGLVSRGISKIPVPIRSGAMRVGTTIAKHPILSAAGGAGAIALGTGAAAGRAGMFGRPAGKHPSARHLHALAMGLRRARPRMNVTNVHALRRSLRRTMGFAKLAMKVIHITHPKKHGRFGGFKKRKRK
jgi:hypothetical protein